MSSKTVKHDLFFRVHYRETEVDLDQWNPYKIPLTDFRNGDIQPRWKQKISDGLQAGTVLSAQRQSFPTLRPFDATIYYKDVFGAPVYSRTTGLTSVAQTGGAGSATINPIKAQDQAMGKYLKQVRAVQTSMAGLTFLGEFREALHMLRHPADSLNRGLADYLHAIKQKKRQNPKTWKKAIGGAWLEHSFGWQPFINDIKDAVKAYSRLKEIAHVQPISASASDTKNPVYSTGAWTFSRYMRVTETTKTQDDCFVKMHGAVWCQASGASFDRDLFGFNLREFVPTAWELIPWSFLADYFSNIGDVLENAVTNTANLRWTVRSTISTQNFMCVHTGNEPLIKATCPRFAYYQERSPGVNTSIGRSVTREILGGTYVPPIRFELPGKPAQFLNMAALLLAGNSIFPQTRRPWR
jgi:hypothetical protein